MESKRIRTDKVKRAPNGAKRVPNGDKWKQKHTKRIPKGAKRMPKGGEREPNAQKGATRNRCPKKVAKKEVCNNICLSNLGATYNLTPSAEGRGGL